MHVHFDLQEQSIDIEGDGPELVKLLELVRDVAPNLPQITINTGKSESPRQKPPESTGNGEGNGNGGTGGQTVRQFIRALPLASNAERIAAIAYYKKTEENVDTFAPKDMSTWFTNCGLQKPNQMNVAIFDAKKRHGYVESSSHGKWKITTNGENLVIGKLNKTPEE